MAGTYEDNTPPAQKQDFPQFRDVLPRITRSLHAISCQVWLVQRPAALKAEIGGRHNGV